MRIYSHFVSGHLINQYLIVNDENKEAVMIDAPDLDGNMIEIIEKNHFTLKALLITHSHEAHIKSLGTIYKIYNPTLYAYFEEIGGMRTRKVEDKLIIREAGLEFECLHVPGHSLDSICYRTGSAIFTGDTLQSGFISQTRALVEKELLIEGIKEKLMDYPDNTLIFPGHGPLSKIRIEKMFNQDILEANILMNLD